MKIGCPNHPRLDLLEEVQWIGTNGFDFLDLFLEPDRALPDRVDPKTLKGRLEEHGLAVVGHTAWYLPFGSPFPELREKAVEIVCGYLPFFQELACPLVTVHANWASGMFSDEECIDFQCQALASLAQAASRFGIGIMVEPMDTPRDTLKNLSRIVSRVPDLMVHVDVGHAHVQGIAPEAFFRQFPGRVVHIHLHDNDGSGDQHLPLDEGTIDWVATVAQIRGHYDGTITLEVFCGDREHLLLSKKKLERYWAEAGKLNPTSPR